MWKTHRSLQRYPEEVLADSFLRSWDICSSGSHLCRAVLPWRKMEPGTVKWQCCDQPGSAAGLLSTLFQMELKIGQSNKRRPNFPNPRGELTCGNRDISCGFYAVNLMCFQQRRPPGIHLGID